MPPVQEDSSVEDTEPGVIKPVIGIIYPPPEVRNIVDKTASFVARNGPEFETRIRQNELNNPKFNFLNPNDPYNAYYQHKVKEFKEGKGQEPMAPKAMSAALARPQEPAKILETIVPKEPPPEFEFVADPPSISAFDLDVVKLTAQFVARNGRQFLTNLMNREQRNYQFDFLRPQHSLFNYFTKLVEQYTKILIPPKDLLNKLRRDADSAKVVLDQVKYRVEWAKYQEREKKKEAEAQERERVAYAQIDWHDFVVVETVDFQPNESGNLPPPTTSEEIGARLLAQERFADKNEDDTVEMEVESEGEEEEEEEALTTTKLLPPGANTQVQDMDEDSEGSDDERQPEPKKVEKPPLPPLPSEAPQPPPLPPMPGQVIVRDDYNPKAPRVVNVAPGPDQFLISPITGEKIPADKIQEHMRIGLLDRKWLEQRDRSISEKREQEEVYAAGSSIDSSLKLLAERRTDIFGHGVEEAQIGKKIGEEEKREKEKVTWDGHTASMERVTQKARENISIEEQIQVIHKVKGLLPDEEKERIGPAQPKGGAPPHAIPPPPAPPVSAPIKPPVPPPPATTTTAHKPPLGAQPNKPIMSTPQPPPPPMQPSIPLPPQPGMMIIHARPPVQPPHGMRPPHMLGMPQRPPMPPMQRPPMGQFMNAPRPPQPPSQPPPPSDEPPSKKAKTEDQLIPEEEFLRRSKGPVNFKVAVPNIQDKPEWKLNGQMLSFTLPLTDSISVIKAKLHEALGMPAGKQKLQCDGLFVKDSNTLAFYNFNPLTVLQLQLKERGGRKK